MLAPIPFTRKLLFVLGIVALIISVALLTTPVSAESFEPTEGLLVVHVTYQTTQDEVAPPTTAWLTRGGGKPIIKTVNPDGYFSIFLPPGSYTLELSAKGFAPFAMKTISIRVGQTTPLSVHMTRLP